MVSFITRKYELSAQPAGNHPADLVTLDSRLRLIRMWGKLPLRARKGMWRALRIAEVYSEHKQPIED